MSFTKDPNMLGLLKEAQDLGVPIKILVMSATLEAESISQYLGGAPTIKVPGRSHPLDLIYDRKPQSLRADHSFYDRVTEKIRNVFHETFDLAGFGHFR